MKKMELIKSIHASLPPFQQRRISKAIVKMVIDEMATTIIAATMNGESVNIEHFGIWEPMKLKGPKNQKCIAGTLKAVEEYIRIIFTADKTWKDLLKNRLKQAKKQED
jgi:nucleoid DNA-binding protein